MTNQTLYTIIATLLAVIVGGGTFVLWVILSDIRERRKHYKATVTVKPDGTLDVYKSKLTEMGKKAIVVVPLDDQLLIDIDVRLSDGEITVKDLRSSKGPEWI